MATHEYNLCLVKGCEVTIEHLIGPSQYDDEIDDSGYDVQDAHFYLTDKDGNEIVIDTDICCEEDDEYQTEELNDDQYVKAVCWRTTEWTVESDEPLTAMDVELVKRKFGDYPILDFHIPKAIVCDFQCSWDGKWQEIVQEAVNPTYVAEDLEE